MIALAQDDQPKALQLAQHAEQINNTSPSPHIALSYVYQAQFDIGKALQSAQKATQAGPRNGLSWARVSELELATGNVDDSMQAADQAQRLNPRLSKTNTVLGFARLASLELSEAEQSFRDAIERDPSDPLARLGLGLAKIRQGHIKSGTRDMETAANLDPGNALIRSYLGKAYYEQRRGTIASTEYKIAKHLDPKDPTPWFYDAIYKQTVNRPVEALHDMQKAIELNDNRAVFRSKLLLDEDLASRSASLGRIYSNLGVQQLGLVESWKALSYDPTDFSAHRLLADNYSLLPRHEIARVSELLRSQLLQPINTLPQQPGLDETNLFVFQGLGPSDASYNDYNPLFTGNGVNIRAGGVVGNNKTWGTDAALTGIFNNWSLSLGEYHFQSDGVRENSDVEHNVYTAFAQTAVSPDLNLQAEYRYRKTESGQLVQKFFGQRENFRQELEKSSARIGLHYKFNNFSEVIGSFSVARAKTRTNDRIPFQRNPGFREVQPSAEDKAYKIELQKIIKQENFKVIAGFGYQNLWRNTKNFDRSTITAGDRAGESLTRENSDFYSEGKFFKTYIYIPFHLNNQLTLTTGLSYANIESLNSSDSKDSINWKFGLLWLPSSSTTVRFAAFKAIKEPFVDERTIEPTQIAGFNQFFDDTNGSDSKRYGIGIDHKLSPDINVGIESSWRDVDLVRADFSHDHDERLLRGYFFWTPTQIVNINLQMIKENYSRDFEGGLSGPSALKTLTIPLAIKYFNPNGFFCRNNR